MSLCIYKDIFGKVGTGVHSLRLFNICNSRYIINIGTCLYHKQ